MTGEQPQDEAAEAAALAGKLSKDLKPARTSPTRGNKHRINAELLGLDPEYAAAVLNVMDRDQTLTLRHRIAWFAIWAVTAQLVLADVIFGWYLWVNGGHGIEPEVMIAWLSATVVEVIGIIVIVARNLFPSPSTRRDES
jgi:hypothetical protein